MKKQNFRRIERLMLVLVSCVIIAVALLNLLHPVTAQAEQTALATGTDVQPTTEPTTEPTAEPTPTAVSTPQPTQAPPADAYKITFGMPQGWSSAASVRIILRVQDKRQCGWQKIEIRGAALQGGGEWLDVTQRFIDAQDDKIQVDTVQNGQLLVRVTDPQGILFAEEATVRCFDRQAPTVSASFDANMLLHVDAQDDLSGVAGIQINALLFTKLESGALNVRMEDALNQYEKLAIRAFDFAGNFSELITLENPYYMKPTEIPTSAPQPTKDTGNAGSGNSENKPTATPKPTAVPTQDDRVIYPTQMPVTATPTPIIQTEYVPLGPGMPYKSSGNMHTLDMLYSAATNKQFITVQARNGATFYLIIDYDKPINEDAELYETYFLNLVDERDLLALLSDEELPSPTPEVIVVTPEPTMVPVVTAVPADAGTADKFDSTKSLLLLAVVTALGLGGACIFLLLKQKKASPQPSPEIYLEDDAEEEDEHSEDTP
mgnify:CR=1 FL=1